MRILHLFDTHIIEKPGLNADGTDFPASMRRVLDACAEASSTRLMVDKATPDRNANAIVAVICGGSPPSALKWP